MRGGEVLDSPGPAGGRHHRQPTRQAALRAFIDGLQPGESTPETIAA